MFQEIGKWPNLHQEESVQNLHFHYERKEDLCFLLHWLLAFPRFVFSQLCPAIAMGESVENGAEKAPLKDGETLNLHSLSLLLLSLFYFFIDI